MKKLAVVSFFLFFVVGCGVEMLIGGATNAIVNGVIYWKEGEASKYYAYEPSILYRSTKKACKELNYEIITDEPNNEDGYYIVAGEKNKFKIKIEQVEENISVVKCRIDFWGDKPYVELFYEKIDGQLSVIEFDARGQPVRN